MLRHSRTIDNRTNSMKCLLAVYEIMTRRRMAFTFAGGASPPNVGLQSLEMLIGACARQKSSQEHPLALPIDAGPTSIIRNVAAVGALPSFESASAPLQKQITPRHPG